MHSTVTFPHPNAPFPIGLNKTCKRYTKYLVGFSWTKNLMVVDHPNVIVIWLINILAQWGLWGNRCQHIHGPNPLCQNHSCKSWFRSPGSMPTSRTQRLNIIHWTHHGKATMVNVMLDSNRNISIILGPQCMSWAAMSGFLGLVG